MATVINDPGPERVVTVERTTTDATSGWAIAVIVLVLVIVGLFVWYHYHHAYAPAQPSNSAGSINIQLPQGNSGNPPADNSGGTGNGTGGTNTGY
jgi:hypothetical protein